MSGKSKRIDLVEFLLLLDGIFGEVHFKLCMDSDKKSTTADVLNEYETIYKPLIIENDLKKYKILNIDIKSHFDEKDYENIKNGSIKVDEYASCNLYFYNLMLQHINNTNDIRNRKVLMYYLMFDNQKEGSGKKFILYLRNRLMEMVCCICNAEEHGDPRPLADSLSGDYDLLNTLFGEAEDIIVDLKKRTLSIKTLLKEKNSNFEYEASETDRWINAHPTQECRSFGDFIFIRSDSYYDISRALISHLIRIYNAVFRDDFSQTWRLFIDDPYAAGPLEMKKAYLKLQEFEEKANKAGFDVEKWGKEYTSELDKAIAACGFNV